MLSCFSYQLFGGKKIKQVSWTGKVGDTHFPPGETSWKGPYPWGNSQDGFLPTVPISKSMLTHRLMSSAQLISHFLPQSLSSLLSQGSCSFTRRSP